MGRRRRRRLHARPSGSQPPETRATAAEPRSPAGHSNKRPSVTDSAPERDKRRKLENDDGEETQVEEQATTEEDQNGLEEIGSDQEGADEAKSDQSGSNGEGSGDQNGDGGGGGLSDGSGPVFGVGDSETSILVTCGRNEGRLYLSKLRVVVNERCRSKCIRTGNAWWTPNEFQFVSGRGAAKDWKRTVKHAGRCLKALLTNGTLSLASTPPRCLCDSCKSQGSGKTANESDETGRTINESGEDLSNGNLVQDTTNIRNKGIKRRRSIKRHIKGDARNQGDRSDEPVPFASRKRRKFRKNSKPEAHSDSTVSLSADIVFDCVTGSKAAAAEEEVVTVAKSSDASSPGGVAPVSEPPLIVKRKPGRPKKKPSVIVSKKPRDVARRGETEVKDTAKKNSISGHGMPLGGVSDGTSGRPDDATPSSELPQDSPAGQTRIIPGAENVLPEIYSTRLNDVAETTSPTPATKAPVSPEAPETVAETKERISKSDALAKDTPHSHGTTTDALATTHDVPTTTLTDQAIPHDVQTTTLDAKTTTHDVHATTHDIHTTTHDVHMTTVTVLSDTNALPSDKRTEEEDVNENSTYEAADPLPVCPSDRTPSGDPDAPDGIEADRKELEDEVIVGGDVKDDVKKRSSPVREDFTETSLVAAHNTAEPRMKSAYLNAVIAELKRKKISRETGVTSNATKDQHHQQRTRHPSSAQLLQPTTLHPTAASLIKAELSPESKSMSDALIRDVQSPSSGLTSSSSSSVSCVSNPSLAFAPSTIVDGKPPCLKPHQPDAGGKDVAPSSDLRSSSSSRRTDSRTSARGNLPMSDFPHDEAAFWRHLPSMVGTEGKAGGGGKPVFGGRVADMSSPLSISQLASICGLSQSQLASLPFPPPQFSLYPPYLFMGFPLQPLLPEFQSGSGSLPPSPAAATTTTGVHPNVQRPPSRPVPPSASSSSSAAAVAPPSQYQHQQQSRRRRSHHHHHCKSSSSVSGPPKDPLLRQPSPDHRANSFSALRKTDSMPTNHSAALFSELNRWRSSAPGLSNQQSTGRTTKSSASNKFNPTVNSVQERKLWRPAAAIASSAKEYSSAYESSIVPPRPSAHASTKECAVTCRSYGDSSLAAHAYRFDSAAPVDFTRGFRARARDEGERKYSSNTGREEYPCDDQGVLDLSKK